MAIGQDAAAQLWNASASGQLTMSPDAAREVAQSYLLFAVKCGEWSDEAGRLQDIHGFGGLNSSKSLQQGFSDKAAAARQVLEQLESAATKMAEGYLQAAGILAESDQLYADALSKNAGQA
ncbi:hypothetical protein [Nocardia asteroides]|uniref:Uncharacterized protein n=1 Tax=Nocardia asteroides NBRC 15531 TaxID=1110697 RepID=U5EBA5_NOCAS|nr:hypothetical protein [Nocardia asteroides]UGT49119.1 hypothetical protein LT345_00325 [Nocardia asteroides]GAD83686.1 hypothetical protein NCAST_20_02550 [Nocardia asteroides NBRC 15531]SFL80913.1 hypothetical protein SAMN05444423_101986 [Nocardia asteroides]VEG31094.1 Uncharacterised protein [Nocardia asteroides]